MTQQFSPSQQARIDERLRIAKLPRSNKSIHDAEVGDLITCGYSFYVIVSLQPYNGYENALMEMFCLDQCPNTGKWGYLQFTTTKHQFWVMDRE